MTLQTEFGTGTPFITAAESLRIRDNMPCRPRPVALAVTLLTGQPHTGQRPVRFTPGRHLLGACGSTAIGLVVSWCALAAGGWWLPALLPGWALTLHGARNNRMMIYHQAAHRNLWARQRLDSLVGALVSGVLMVQDFHRYRVEHVADHHAVHHMTIRDPTVQAFLVGLDLHPGMTRSQMWRRISFGKLLSPRYHVSFLVGRIHSAFVPANRTARTLLVLGYLAAAAVITWAHAWIFVLVAWVVPMTVIYQVSNTLRLCVKHTFPSSSDRTNRRSRESFAGLTNAIFIGEPLQLDRTAPLLQRVGAWTRWWARMLLIHFPVRYLVLTGDTVVHDYHHRRPMDRNWANYIFARQQDIDAGHRGWPGYRGIWGIIPAVNAVLDSLSAADPAEYDAARVKSSSRSLFSAFDD